MLSLIKLIQNVWFASDLLCCSVNISTPLLGLFLSAEPEFLEKGQFSPEFDPTKIGSAFFYHITTSPLLSPNLKRKSGSSSRGDVINQAPRHICCSSSLLLFIFSFDIESARKNLTVFYSFHFSSCLASGLPLLPRALQRVTRDQSPHTHCVLCWHSRRDGSKTPAFGRAFFLSAAGARFALSSMLLQTVRRASCVAGECAVQHLARNMFSCWVAGWKLG